MRIPAFAGMTHKKAGMTHKHMKLFAKKSLGQHFLNSPTALKQIISAAEIRNDETVLEIGPGTGILTAELLKTGAKVIAVEKDDRAISLLEQTFANEFKSGQLTLIHGDILELDMASIGLANDSYKLVANIPYYITGAILERFLEHEPRPKKIVLLVQKEVAERIIARDGKESILSISVKAFGMPKIIATVPRGAFTPAPNVDSAILAIAGIAAESFKEIGIDIRGFFSIVRAGFAHKRKLLKRNLEAVCEMGKIEEAWKALGLDEKARAEDLKPSDWISISKELHIRA